MKIAYILLAHRIPEQLIRLVNRLNTANAHFFIHVDKRTEDAIFEQMCALAHLPNVQFLNRHVCNWSGFGHVAATIEGMQAIVNSAIKYDYVSLLTGQDYPIRSNDQIEFTLASAGGHSFVNYLSFPVAGWRAGGYERYQQWHFWIGDRLIAFPTEREFQHPILKPILNRLWKIAIQAFPFKRKFLPGLRPYGGSAYWCISKECHEYLLRFIDTNPSFVDYFRYVHIPDEMIFHTILANSPLRDTLINDHLRHIDWNKPNPPYPAVLTMADFPEIIEAEALFARNFDMTIDSEVLDRIDSELLGWSLNQSVQASSTPSGPQSPGRANEQATTVRPTTRPSSLATQSAFSAVGAPTHGGSS